MKLYRPSNGTEGMYFIDDWCFKCERDKDEDCPLLAASLAYAIDEPEYPQEWHYDDKGEPICSEFIALGEPAPLMRRDRDTQTEDMFGGEP